MKLWKSLTLFLGGPGCGGGAIRCYTGCRGHKIHFQMMWVETDKYNIPAPKLVSHNCFFTRVCVHSENPPLIVNEVK